MFPQGIKGLNLTLHQRTGPPKEFQAAALCPRPGPRPHGPSSGAHQAQKKGRNSRTDRAEGSCVLVFPSQKTLEVDTITILFYRRENKLTQTEPLKVTCVGSDRAKRESIRGCLGALN